MRFTAITATMYSSYLVYCAILVCTVIGRSQAFDENTTNALLKCQKTHAVDNGVAADVLAMERLSDKPNAKCMAACWIEELKILVNGVVNEDVIVKLGLTNYITEASRKKSNEGVMMCISKNKSSEKCDVGYEVVSCYIDFVNKNNLKRYIFTPK